MPYEYYLESENEQRMFTEETLKEMREFLSKVPHHKFDNNSYVIFEDNQQKDVAIPGILSNIAQGRNDYSHSGITISPTLIHLSIIGDSDVDIHIYKFVIWCQKRYPCQLYERSRPVPPEELFPFEEEGFVPSIS